MLDIGGLYDLDRAVCYFLHSSLPQYIDDAQPPTKRKPFSTILSHPFNHSVSRLLPILLSRMLITHPVPNLAIERLSRTCSRRVTNGMWSPEIRQGAHEAQGLD